MKEKKKQLTSEETRRQKILDAALTIFVEKGFAGASMSHIAKSAGVPQSLIYHYFANKEELWRQAKDAFVTKHLQSNQDQEEWQNLPLEKFVEKFVRQRFDFYLHNPLVIRMMNWQRLEAEKSLSGRSTLTTSWLVPHLEEYQRQKVIPSDHPPKLMASWMTASITAPLFDHLDLYVQDPKLQADYIQMVTQCLLRSLCP